MKPVLNCSCAASTRIQGYKRLPLFHSVSQVNGDNSDGGGQEAGAVSTSCIAVNLTSAKCRNFRSLHCNS
jgi:hypothetical protein